MNIKRQYKFGFTLIEAMISMTILIIAMVIAVTGLSYVLRGERLNSVQNELDIDVRTTMERLRNDLRLSSLEYIFVWPQGVSTNTAISFPKARDDDGDGLIELDANGKIIWDVTLIYHVWNSSPNELRLTTFDTRDNSLNDAQRQDQLESVVLNGTGAGTYNSANASTRALFRNLFFWDIRGKGAQFDTYAPTLARMPVEFGSCLLDPGAHDFKFDIVGKNAASSGYKIGIDSLIVSPSGVKREAEDQIPPSVQSGASATEEYMAGGNWSGNYQLNFDAGGIGDYFVLSMDNDRWEEQNFDGEGAVSDDCIAEFDETLTPKSFVVMPSPVTNAWQSNWQTLNANYGSSSGGELRGKAIRILLRGDEMWEGGAIKYSGPLHCIWFYAGVNQLQILEARIAEATNPATYCMDFDPTTDEQLFFYGTMATYTISAGSYARAWPANDMWIDSEKSYLLSLLVVNDSGKSDARYWEELHTGAGTNPPPGCYYIDGTNSPTVSDIRAPIWSSNPLVQTTNRLYALQHLHILAASNGTYTSQIVDTKISSPTYKTVDWTAIKPSGTDVKIKVRTDSNPDMSTAPDWTNVTASSSPGAINPGSGRYVQFQAVMDSSSSLWYVPKLRDVTIDWDGVTRLTDVGATLTMGPDYGIFELTVDNKPLIRGMSVDLTIYKDIRGFGGKGSNRLTSTLSAEVEPRNTGK